MASRYFLAILIQVVVHSVGPHRVAADDLTDLIDVDLMAVDTTTFRLNWDTTNVPTASFNLVMYEVFQGNRLLTNISDDGTETGYSYNITELQPGNSYAVTLLVTYRVPKLETTEATSPTTAPTTTTVTIPTTSTTDPEGVFLKAAGWSDDLVENFTLSTNTYPAIPTNVTVTSRDTNSLILEWPVEGTFERCYVWITNETASAATCSTGGQVDITDLPVAGRLYDINLVVQSGSLNSSSSPDIYQERTLPVRPYNVSCYEKTNSSLTVTVTSSQEPSETQQYRVEYSVLGNLLSPPVIQDVGGEETNVELPSLEAGLLYDIQVFALAADSLPSKDSADTSCTTVPPAPVKVSLEAVDTTALDLSWEAPSYYGNVTQLLGYNITWDDQDFYVSVDESNTYQFRNLSVPGALYHVSISAYYEELGNSVFIVASSNTYPASPSFDSVSRTTDQLITEWSYVGVADDCNVWIDNGPSSPVESCVVSSAPSPSTITATLSSLPIAGGNYVINVGTQSGGLRSMNSTTTQRTLPPDPAELYCVPVNTTTTTLGYGIPAPSTSPETFELDGYYVNISSTITNFDYFTSTTLATTGSITAIQTNLIAGVTYRIVVVTKIENLNSTLDSSKNCTTDLNAPIDTAVTGTSETSVNVSWMTPQGYFEKFNLFCIGMESATEDGSNTTYDLPKGPSEDPATLSAACGNLTAGALYNVTVETALNNSALTNPRGSNSVFGVTVPYTPDVLAVPINTESVTLTIGRPAGSQCTSYAISYSSQTSNNNTSIPCGQGETNLSDLSPDSSYDISVYSVSDYSAEGAGIEHSSSSIPAEVWTLPQSVRNINETEALPWSLNVLISSPVQHSNVWQYVIRVINSTQNIIQRINVTCEDVEMKTMTTIGCDYPNDPPVTNHTSVNCSDEFECNITGLEPFISYSISVQAVNPGGCSLSEEGFFTTRQAFPGCVEVTNATGTSSNTIDVTWEQPVSPNGVTVGYVVRYTNVETEETSSINVISPNDTSTTLDNLDAYANYKIQVAARNDVGVGPFDGCEYSSPITQTRIGAPFTPELSTVSSDPYSINISWTLSEGKKTGPETYYNVTVTDPLNITAESFYSLIGFNNRSVVAVGLRPYWNYNIQINAYTIDETGKELPEPGQPAWERTNQSTPGAVQTFNVTSLESLSLCSEAQVTWVEPSLLDRNGIITGYRITWSQTDGSDMHEENFTLEQTVANLTVQADEKKYTFTIQAKTFAPGNTTTIDLLSTGSCKPTPFSVEEAVSDPSVVSLAYNTKTFTIQISKNVFLNNPNGVIKTGGLVVAQVSDDLGSQFDGDYGLYNESLPWSEALSGSVVPAYRATPDDWFGNYIDAGAPASTATTTSPAAAAAYFRLNAVASSDSVNNNADELFSYTIGETDCSKKSQAYCNGPLPSNRRYKVSVIACTTSGCFRTDFTPFFWETKKVDYGWVAGVVIGILAVIALAIVGFFLWRRWMEKRENKENTVLYDGVNGHGNAGTLEKVTHIPQPPAAVRVDDFPQHVDDMHRNSDWAFNDEYQTIQDRSPKHPWTSAEIPQNRVKNRFVNILPFDHSRVKMNVVDDDEGGTDYINANYIPNAQNIREFIASQGPLQSTVDDFWRMIWEQRIKVIVMLTNVREKGKEKCAQYWPTTTDELSEYGDVAVKMISESNMNYSVIRKLQVQCNNEIREVFQFHYIVWPDFGVPSDHETVLAFVKEVRLHAGQNVDPPIVVHCSAGVGRTGTFIMLDRLLKQFRNSDSIDVFGMLLQMRNHRTLMVQTEAQYVFIHDCLKMEIEKSLFPTQDYDNDAYEDNDEGLYANSDQFQPPQKPQKPQRPEKPPKPVETGDVELSTFGR